uniref:protein SRC2-like n=1 Tax=Erigeron canadensis TaxID=72917 RepID=UPI001CB9C097|nr:protein SRC2-like [Erigeron canadensis]
MDYRQLDITVISASGLKNVNFFMKMGVYVVVSLISSNSITKQKTHVSNCNKNPRWNRRINFAVQESAIQTSTLLFILYSKRVFGDRIIGEVLIPVRELLENVPTTTGEHTVEYQVCSIRGTSRGTFTFSYKFQERNNNDNNTFHPIYAMQQGVLSCCGGQGPYPPPQGYHAYVGHPQQVGGWYQQSYLHQQMGYGFSQQQRQE